MAVLKSHQGTYDATSASRKASVCGGSSAYLLNRLPAQLNGIRFVPFHEGRRYKRQDGHHVCERRLHDLYVLLVVLICLGIVIRRLDLSLAASFRSLGAFAERPGLGPDRLLPP